MSHWIALKREALEQLNSAYKHSLKIFKFQYQKDPHTGFFVTIDCENIYLKNSEMFESGSLSYGPTLVDNIEQGSVISNDSRCHGIRKIKKSENTLEYNINTLFAGDCF